jgi:hypothetical protein
MKLKIEREIWPQCISNVTTDTDKVMKNYFDKYKFAELIVRECIAVMEITAKEAKEAKEHHVYIDDDVPTSTHQYKIKQHFGIDDNSINSDTITGKINDE